MGWTNHTEMNLRWVRHKLYDWSHVVQNLLTKLAVKYPQAIFYELNHYIQQRVAHQHTLNSSAESSEKADVGLERANEVMNVLKQNHTALCNNLVEVVRGIPNINLIYLFLDDLMHCHRFCAKNL